MPPPLESPHVSVEPFGAVSTTLLRTRLTSAPTAIGLLHTMATSCERGEPAGGKEAIAVWVRVAWSDKSETLGFISRRDAELIAGLWPEVTQWFSQMVRYADPCQRSR